MSPRRRRKSQTLWFLILIALLIMLWYAGKIPGVPGPSTVIPQLRGVLTSVPNSDEFIKMLPNVFQPATSTPIVSSGSNEGIGQRTKASNCVSSNALPDPACTPGAIFPDATTEQICTPGYSSKVRDVPESVKDQVYAEYGITSHVSGQYEVDHLISLELGGSNDIANLWPELASPTPGFHEKDEVENYLHEQVCNGAMPLKEAQSLIAHDWPRVYQSLPK